MAWASLIPSATADSRLDRREQRLMPADIRSRSATDAARRNGRDDGSDPMQRRRAMRLAMIAASRQRSEMPVETGELGTPTMTAATTQRVRSLAAPLSNE
jgi:hypothetical protein